ncbi:IS30 family transposase [Oscillibacter valericigenes]|nr:IS30 family transposase [Oscillibacter valericigenes]
MGHYYSHLSKTDRYKIEAMLNSHCSKKEIAAELHVHISTVYREIKRARWVHLDGDTWIEEERYNPDGAEKRYRDNLAAKGAPLKIGNDFEFAGYIENKILNEDRSPAAALADAKLEGKQFKTSICVSTLYSYISKGVFLTITNKDLPEKPKRKRQYHKVKTMKRPPRGESIEKRPAEVDSRTTFGHWEMDTVYSKKKGSKALLVLTERLTRKEIIEKMPDRTAESTVRALDRIERRFGARFRLIFKTITVDNGGEFADVERLERSAIRKGKRTKFYYCHPYSSFERGSNECQNKMIRRKYPKGTDFGKVTAAAVKEVEEWVNNYPREILGWRTSETLFQECVAALGF